MIADGVSTGYAEVRIAMRGKRVPRRPWARHETRPGLTGARLQDWVRTMAARYPGSVKVN